MKKNRILIIIFSLIMISCVEKNKDTSFIISIENKTNLNDTLSIYDYYWDIVKKIPVSKNSIVIDTLNNFERNYYFLKTNQTSSTVIFASGQKSIVKISDKNIKFFGDGGNENNYLTKKRRFLRSLPNTSPTSNNHLILSEKGYLELLDSNYDKKIKFLESFKGLNKDFIDFEKRSIGYSKKVRLAYYESNMQFLKDDENYKVSKEFPKVFDKVDFNDGDLSINHNYLSYLRAYIEKEVENQLKTNPKLDKVLTRLQIVDKLISNQVIRNNLSYSFVRLPLISSNNKEEAYRMFNTINNNKRHIKIIDSLYVKLSELKDGDYSPDFSFKDKNNRTITLSEFKGYYVYIDIWNTYCKPCILEIPKFEKLKKEFSDKKIKFISICVNSKKENWERLIRKMNLSDYQIYVEKPKDIFFEKYSFNSAPRYILIDDKGKIINKLAKRPSNPKLKQQLEEILN